MEKNQNLNNKNYIEYSTKIFDSINKERPSFILKDLEVKNDKGDINRILAIILKYKKTTIFCICYENILLYV